MAIVSNPIGMPHYEILGHRFAKKETSFKSHRDASLLCKIGERKEQERVSNPIGMPHYEFGTIAVCEGRQLFQIP